ncbi:MAG: putative quinol monooxygenase [Pseudomonadota bacterium]
MFVVVVFFEIKPERIESFRHAMLRNARISVEREPGCSQFDVSIDPTDGGSFFLYEVYDDEAAFNAHTQSDHYKAFAETVASWVVSKRVLTYERLPTSGLV